jgi:N6-L-threonylcarbamoyladenine synthase
VGLTAAKTLCLAVGIPLVAVNHIEAHIYACRMAAGRDIFPAIGLVVSGGHTNLYECASAVDFRLLGSTLDDAAGEAFDKVAQILKLGFPGGPAIERAARDGNPRAFRFPRAFIRENRLEFSFSGLKTAVLYEVTGTPGAAGNPPPLTPVRCADVAASFQEAVVDVLVEKCRQALIQYERSVLCVGGGVAANSLLRSRLEPMAARLDVELFIPTKALCTDNAAMAALGWEHLERGRTAPADLDVTAGLVRHR